jgi:short-subunit dehydrogenase
MNLAGKRIVITGGGGGIGSLLHAALTAKQAEIYVLDRQSDNAGARHIAADLSQESGIAQAVEALHHLQPDILVNLAGMQFFGAFEQEPPEHLHALMQVNLVAPMRLSQAVIPSMRRKREGMIVNIGSVFGALPSAYFAAYSTSKAGMRALSDALRRELDDTGITVVHVAPRAVRTALNNAQVMALAKATKMHMDTPEHVAQRIIAAMEGGRAHTVIGFPERLFVKLHGLSHALIDKGMRPQTQAARHILAPTQH